MHPSCEATAKTPKVNGIALKTITPTLQQISASFTPSLVATHQTILAKTLAPAFLADQRSVRHFLEFLVHAQ
jgi:hypothetical protein